MDKQWCQCQCRSLKRLKEHWIAGTISDLSSELGIDTSKVAPILAMLLPVIINQLTPDGQQSGDGSLLSSGMSVLKGFM